MKPRRPAVERAERRLVERLRRQLAAERRDRAARSPADRLGPPAAHVRDLVARELALLPPVRRDELEAALLRQTVGWGPLETLMADREVTEVLVTGPDRVYLERQGRLERADLEFEGERELSQVIERLLSAGGRRVDELSPMADSILPDGSRVNVVIPPLAIGGPQVSIRRFGAMRPALADLEASGMFDARASAIFAEAACAGFSVLISGGTSSGKTTLLAAIAAEIPAKLRVIAIEDSAEIPFDREHVVRLQSRPPGMGGLGEVTIRDLVRNAMRMRPDRIVVGEVRGPEAFDLLAALNTGHRGLLSTIHANAARDALERLRDLAALAGIGIPVRTFETQARRALDLVVHLRRSGDARELIDISRPIAGSDDLEPVWSRADRSR